MIRALGQRSIWIAVANKAGGTITDRCAMMVKPP
jgi:hypothetical protein